ncbi:hypothetical protein J4Q44_G00023520 [Coregonus suidteri]|uniref:Uncharacterized protein n=1 Tax=Coregonus suidteri TaxID=861788 RepID=A0AAN8RGF0_9TELE
MSKIELLRVFLNQRLIMAAEEIFGVVEETIAEYQEENSRLRSMLDIVIKPDILLQRIDIQQPTLPVSENEALPEQQHCEQEWSPSLGQEDPHYIQIKEEPEELESSLKNDYHHQDLTQSSLLYETQSEDYEGTYYLPSTSTAQSNYSLHSTSTEQNMIQLKPEPDAEDNGVSEPSTAAEEIFGVVEETIAEYQEEVSRTKEENRHLRSMLDVRTKTDIKLHSQADLQQLTVTVSDEVISPEQQEWSPSLGQKDPEPTQMKDEQEEPRTSQEDENHVNEFINCYGCVSSGYYQDPTQSSHGERYSLPSTSTEQIKTEPYVEDYGVSEPTRESQPFSAVDTECSAAQSENRGHIDRMESGGPLSVVCSLSDRFPRCPFPRAVGWGLLVMSGMHNYKHL